MRSEQEGSRQESRGKKTRAAAVKVVRLHEDDIRRIAADVVAEIRRDRLVDEVARKLRVMLSELASR